MTTPGGSVLPPEGSFLIGSGFGQNITESSATAEMADGTLDVYSSVQDAVGSQLRTPTANAQSTANSALATAGTAVSTASAAANAAADAGEKADVAYALATEWGEEFLVSSAEVLLGTNELLVGPMLDVRDGRTAILTDIHLALLDQPGGMTVETRVWNAANTSYTAIHTGTIGANVTRRNFSGLSVTINDLERFFAYVTSITGTVAPTVLQIRVAGVYIDAP